MFYIRIWISTEHVANIVCLILRRRKTKRRQHWQRRSTIICPRPLGISYPETGSPALEYPEWLRSMACPRRQYSRHASDVLFSLHLGDSSAIPSSSLASSLLRVDRGKIRGLPSTRRFKREGRRGEIEPISVHHVVLCFGNYSVNIDSSGRVVYWTCCWRAQRAARRPGIERARTSVDEWAKWDGPLHGATAHPARAARPAVDTIRPKVTQ